MSSYTTFIRELALDRRALLSSLVAGGVYSGLGGVYSGLGGVHSGLGGVHSGLGGVHSGPGGVHSGPGDSIPSSRNRPLGNHPLDTAGDLAAAQRIAGLAFGPAELAMAARSVEQQRRGFDQLRARAMSWWTAPAWTFDPLPHGVAPPAAQARFAVALPDGELSREPADLAYASIPHLAALVSRRVVTSRQLTELALARLKRFDPQLHCVVTLLEKAALAAADRADQEIAAGGWRGPLHGIPYGAKDLFAWPGAPTTFGAAPFADQVLDLKATALQRLEAAGAVLCAKLSLGALAMGDYWFKGRTRNPWQLEQGSSGSSAGSAAAVTAGLLPFALGTETLGSIVSPCSTCGVAGLRPTFGTVSRHGAMPLSWSMDKVGVIARHASDLAIVFERIHGADGHDRMVRDSGFAWPSPTSLRGLRVGVVGGGRGRGRPGGAPRGDANDLLAWLRQQGAVVKTAALPDFPYAAIRVILVAEAATAFDDLTRSPDIARLTRQTPGSWPNRFRAARFVPAVEYLRATRVRTGLIQAMHEMMRGFDVLVAARSSEALTCTNLTGHPTVVLPTGPGRGRSPTSTSIIGHLYGESTLLAVANAWQQHTRWHLGRPL
jgi:Asp-tRNA(Asn)/Glu-tRNA(Gln) amidotransferase A subunit family amidase